MPCFEGVVRFGAEVGDSVRVIDFNQRTARETGLVTEMARRFGRDTLITQAPCRHLLENLAQLVAKVLHFLETILRFFRECFIDDLLQPWGNRT